MGNIDNGCDEDGQAKEIFRESAFGVSRSFPAYVPITSELKCRAKVRCLRVPALRDSACWSVKGRQQPQVEWYRGYGYARLKNA